LRNEQWAVQTYFSQKLPKVPQERFLALEKLGYAPVYTLWQEHGDNVVCLDGQYEHPGLDVFMEEQAHGDAVIVSRPGLYAGVKTADCVPILLWDETAGVCAAVHAGWRGTALGIVYKTAMLMRERFHAAPGRLRAAIGPCICKDCFETHRDVPDAMPEWARGSGQWIRDSGQLGTGDAASSRGAKYHVDLPGINRLWLERAGVGQVAMPEACTACQPEIYWSHRRHGKDRGLQVSLVGLRAAPESYVAREGKPLA